MFTIEDVEKAADEMLEELQERDDKTKYTVDHIPHKKWVQIIDDINNWRNELICSLNGTDFKPFYSSSIL